MAEKSSGLKKFVENNPKTIIVGGVLVGAVALGFFFRKKLNTALNNIFAEDNLPIIDGVGADFNPQLATITAVQAKNLAQQLLEAMEAWGTDTDRIEAVFEHIKNKHDFLLVFHAFGYQPYTGAGLPPSGWLRHIAYYAKRNLVYWLDEELGILDRRLRRKIKKVINNAGFVF